MKVAILGAGGIGCFLGGAWHAAGMDVTLIGRARLAEEIGGYGLTLTDFNGWRAALPDIALATDPAALAAADLIALCVKSVALDSAAETILRHSRAGTPVIAFQNGVSAATRLADRLGRPVLRGMFGSNIVHWGQGRFHRATFGDVYAEDDPLTRRLAPLTGEGPARLRLASDMVAIAWGKLLLNLNNAVNALSGLTLQAELSRRDYRRVLAAAQGETLLLLAAAGIQPARLGPLPPGLVPRVLNSPDWLFRNLFLRLQRVDPSARSSMADDFAAGRATEVDDLNGEVVALAARLGREAPVNRAIVDLIRAAEAGGRTQFGPEALCRAVLGR